MTFDELKRLSFCDSPKLPQKIKIYDCRTNEWVFRQWVGIGWVDCDADESAVEITE